MSSVCAGEPISLQKGSFFCVIMNIVHAAVAQDGAGMTLTVLQCTTSMQEALAL